MRSCPGRSQSRRTSATVAGQGHHTVGECAFLLKSCSSLRRCTARPPDRSDWSVCRVCSPSRPPALRMVHISNFTSQFQHTRTHTARFSRRVPSDHRMAVQRRGPVKVSVCMKKYTYCLGPVHRRPAVNAKTDKNLRGGGPNLVCDDRDFELRARTEFHLGSQTEPPSSARLPPQLRTSRGYASCNACILHSGFVVQLSAV